MAEESSAPHPSPPGEVTRLLAAARSGDEEASGQLFELVYGDLRRLARRHAQRGRTAGPSATSLVHEAFLRLNRHQQLPYADRTHFFAVASRAMRQIVIDEARKRLARRRSGVQTDLDLELVAPVGSSPASPVEDVLAIHDALAELERDEPRLARTVEWHFFGGLTFSEIAAANGVSERTVLRDWRTARALLHARLEDVG